MVTPPSARGAAGQYLPSSRCAPALDTWGPNPIGLGRTAAFGQGRRSAAAPQGSSCASSGPPARHGPASRPQEQARQRSRSGVALCTAARDGVRGGAPVRLHPRPIGHDAAAGRKRPAEAVEAVAPDRARRGVREPAGPRRRLGRVKVGGGRHAPRKRSTAGAPPILTYPLNLLTY